MAVGRSFNPMGKHTMCLSLKRAYTPRLKNDALSCLEQLLERINSCGPCLRCGINQRKMIHLREFDEAYIVTGGLSFCRIRLAHIEWYAVVCCAMNENLRNAQREHFRG